MKIDMEFIGFDELLAAFQKAANPAEIQKVDKKIAERSQPIVKDIMQKNIPKSSNTKYSGRGFGKKSSVDAHAADSIPTSKIKMKDKGVEAHIGWEKSDSSPHFYVKFINWGTIYKPPQEFIYKTGRIADSHIQKIAEQEYQMFLDNTIK